MTLVASAPGKVLIAGGYLVLDPKYSGVVVSASSRFYTIIRESTQGSVVKVRSPQFVGAEWEAGVLIEGDHISLQDIDESNSMKKNKFVYLAIQKVLSLVVELKGTLAVETRLERGIEVIIVGDNDFYSQRGYLEANHLPPTFNSLKMIPPFAPCNVTLGDVHKTGLGSSASLITSLVTALLLQFAVISSDDLSRGNSHGKSLVHNVAQYIHCLAQGKVGSGFDVSSAVFGSHIYKRFDPEVIAALMDKDSGVRLMDVLSPLNNAWNHEIKPFRLPPGMRLMLADVDAGSDTPSLVGKVLRWRSENATEAAKLWDDLSSKNLELAAILTELLSLHVQNNEDYRSAMSLAANAAYSQWSSLGRNGTETQILEKLSDTRLVAESIREYMRKMGTASGTPIEPPEQTKLLDACLLTRGVVAGGVPGAGGYDALWLLVLESGPDDNAAAALVQEIWLKWTELDVSPLSATESREGGVRAEKVEDIRGLVELL